MSHHFTWGATTVERRGRLQTRTKKRLRRGIAGQIRRCEMKGLFLVVTLIAACVAFIVTGHRDAASWATLAAIFIVIGGGLES